MRGRKYTWYRSDGQATSKLDRFLVSESFLQSFQNVDQRGLQRSLSDHCPIMLQTRVENWGPKPFRTIDSWLTHPEFEQFVKERWNSFEVRGWGGYRLKEKLKMLKKELRIWNKEVFGVIDNRIEEAKETIKLIDEKNDMGQISEMEKNNRETSFRQLQEWADKKSNLMFQKARQRWLKEGDSNSKYFHSCVARRRSQNSLSGIVQNGRWMDGVQEVKTAVKDFFKEKFREDSWNRPVLEGISFNKISEEENAMLVAEFAEEEIKEAVWNCGGSKSPGPDGFNFNFIQRMWSTLKKEICEFIREFHRNGKLVKGSNASFIVLVPKKTNPQGMNDFRPISLIGSMYKIISKLLANRLRMVMPSIISESQTAFVGNRQITDGIIIINEMLHDMKRGNKAGLIFKADFEKAYDNVDWGFLDFMMDKLGFAMKWREWMRECVSIATVSVLINGSPTEEFNVGRGLRQGDPLSPFLFLMVAEALSGLMRKAEETGMLKGIQVGKGELRISHLQFADDTILISEASEENAWAMKCVMRCFELISGLKVNFDKSWLYGMNVDSEYLGAMASIMNCSVGSIPFKYLGVPVGANPNRISTWSPVIECMRRRLDSWGGVALSFGGRIVLLNAILSCLPVYLFSIFKAPKKVIYLLTKLQRNFLWGGGEGKRRIAWIKWEEVCRKKSEGGLGVRNLEGFNKALLGKWKWRILREKKSLWRRVIWEKYGSVRERGWDGCAQNEKGSAWWRGLWKLERVDRLNNGWLKDGCVRTVRDGKETMFWEDVWIGGESLKEKYPRLFSLATNKRDTIAEVRRDSEGVEEWQWSWRRNLFVWEHNLWQELKGTLSQVQLKQGQEDYWSWRWEKKGEYTTRSAYYQITQSQSAQDIGCINLIWKSTAPLKVAALAWRAFFDRLPTKTNLARRGIIMVRAEIMCSWCSTEEESLDHLFFKCLYSWKIWTYCYTWWNFSLAAQVNVQRHYEQHMGLIQKKELKEAWRMIWLTTIWTVWVWRNQKVFGKEQNNEEEVRELIKHRSFYWLKAKLYPNLQYDIWKDDPRLAIKRHADHETQMGRSDF
ncbi:hypothetical protein SLA2020_324880 [Shorea laevis]